VRILGVAILVIGFLLYASAVRGQHLKLIEELEK